MSWSAPEYLYMLLVLNETQLPEEALFLLRYQRCTSLTRGAYRQLMSDQDRALLPLLASFQRLTAYRRAPLPPGALSGDALLAHYDALIERYLGSERLCW
jgi:inositol oxygenase